MRNLFRRRSSCQVAKDRLRILLISDRVNCSPEMTELIKTDIIKVLSKYMRIDTKNVDIRIAARNGRSERAGRSAALTANIPILDLHKQ